MQTRILRRTLALLVVSVTAACASGATSSGTGAASPPPNRSFITEAEIPTTGTETAYEMIQRLRPEYLRTKPSQTYTNASSSNAPPAALILNGIAIGQVADLRQIPASALSMVRYYGIEEGKIKFGMQYGGGVIEISYRQR